MYNVTQGINVPIKHWTKNVNFEVEAFDQLVDLSAMPFLHKWISVMPDVHGGKGSTIGSVIATDKAIIPAAVGVDLGCGMMACKTTLKAVDLPDNLKELRFSIEELVPHGKSSFDNKQDKGGWRKENPPWDRDWET